MTVVTKTIGRLPMNKGDWDANYVNPKTGQNGYGLKFRTIRYGCELESKMENNTYDPIAWDGAETFTIDTAHWLLISGSPEAWLDGQDKPATTGTTGDYPYNGMGQVVLKKHIVEVGGVEKNLLYQDDFKKGPAGARVDNENTVFVIKYDFELAEDITIPANCVLEFDGGSIIGNGTITGTNTVIKAGNCQIFATGIVKYRGYTVNGYYRYATKVYGDDINIAGTWNNEHVEPAWVGLDNVSPTEESAVKLQRYFTLHNEKAVVNVPKNTYYVYNPINVNRAVDFNCSMLKLCKFSDIYDATIELPSGAGSLPAEDVYGLESVYGTIYTRTSNSFLKNVTVDGNKANNVEKIRLGVTGLLHADVDNYLFENVILQNSMNNGIIGGKITNSVFDHCAIKETSEHGFYTGGTAQDTITFNNCEFYNCGNSVETATYRGGASYVIKGVIQVEDEHGNVPTGETFKLTFNDCSFDSNSAAETGIFDVEAGSITLNSCYIGRGTNSLGANRTDGVFRHLEIVANNCTNYLDYNAVRYNTFVTYNRCKGNIVLTKGIELNACDMTSIYIGETNVNFTEDYTLHDKENLNIYNSRVTIRNAENICTDITCPVNIVGSELTDSNHEDTIRDTRIFDKSDLTIKDSKVILRRLQLFYGGNTNECTLKNTILIGHNSYFVRSAKTLTVENILCLHGSLYYGYNVPNIVDNTKRTIRLVDGSDGERMQGYNYTGFVTNIVDGKSQLDGYPYCANGGQAVMATYLNSIARSQLVLCINGVWVDALGRTVAAFSGATRPTNLNNTTDVGYQFFDTSLHKPVFWTGDTSVGDNGWVDANGNLPNPQ